MNNIYWIGPRQSDIDNTNFKFAGSITIYGSNINGNTAYCSVANKRIIIMWIMMIVIDFLARN